VATTNYDNCIRASLLVHRHSSRLSSPVASTIVLLFFYGVTVELIRRRLQSVQNAAIRLVMGTKRSDHISPGLRQRHWLLVRQCVIFKVAVLVYQSLPCHAPGYLVDDCPLLTDMRARQLHSADTRMLAVNRMYSSFGDGTFAAAGTRVWNSLLPDLRKYGLRRPVQAVIEDIFIWTVRPRHSVNSLSYARCAI